MNPVRKRRLVVTLVILAAVAIAAGISVFALQQNMTYLYSPSEVDAGKAPPDGQFRLGGIVEEGSIRRVPGSLTTDFVITDRFKNIPVQYTGILPDLFRVGQSTITTGTMVAGKFVATKVLAKHDATYMPPQVEQAIAKAKAMDEGAGSREQGAEAKPRPAAGIAHPTAGADAGSATANGSGATRSRSSLLPSSPLPPAPSRP